MGVSGCTCCFYTQKVYYKSILQTKQSGGEHIEMLAALWWLFGRKTGKRWLTNKKINLGFYLANAIYKISKLD